MSTMMNDELREYLQNDIGAMTEDSLRRMTARLKRNKEVARDIRLMLDTDTQGKSAPMRSPYVEALQRLANRMN